MKNFISTIAITLITFITAQAQEPSPSEKLEQSRGIYEEINSMPPPPESELSSLNELYLVTGELKDQYLVFAPGFYELYGLYLENGTDGVVADEASALWNQVTAMSHKILDLSNFESMAHAETGFMADRTRAVANKRVILDYQNNVIRPMTSDIVYQLSCIGEVLNQMGIDKGVSQAKAPVIPPSVKTSRERIGKMTKVSKIKQSEIPNVNRFVEVLQEFCRKSTALAPRVHMLEIRKAEGLVDNEFYELALEATQMLMDNNKILQEFNRLMPIVDSELKKQASGTSASSAKMKEIKNITAYAKELGGLAIAEMEYQTVFLRGVAADVMKQTGK